MGRPADFFVSYTSAGRTWAEWIAWQLEAEGYQVVVQAWDFTPGHDWAHEMQDTTATAKRVVVVLSPAYLGSAHGEAEWRGLYADDPSGERGLLLVVRVEQVKPPGLLKTRVYVDAARPSSAVRPHQPCLLLCRPDGAVVLAAPPRLRWLTGDCVMSSRLVYCADPSDRADMLKDVVGGEHARRPG